MPATRVVTRSHSKVPGADFSTGVDPWVRKIVNAARKNGLSVRRCKSDNPKLARCTCMRSFKKYEILINGKNCQLRFTGSMRKTNAASRQYYSFCDLHGSLDCDFLIIWQAVNRGRIFVIPTDRLEGRYNRRILFPIREDYLRSEDDHSARWLQYLRRWDLIKKAQ